MPKRRTENDWEIERLGLPIIHEAFVIEATIALAKMQDNPAEWVRRFMDRIQRQIDYPQESARDVGVERPLAFDAARVLIEKWTGYCSNLGLSDETSS